MTKPVIIFVSKEIKDTDSLRKATGLNIGNACAMCGHSFYPETQEPVFLATLKIKNRFTNRLICSTCKDRYPAKSKPL